MSTRTRDREREDSEEHGHIRSTGKRPIPFLAPGLVAFVLLPLLFAISRWVKWWDDTTGVMIADWWLGAGCILALVAAYVGVRHAKRAAFVANHVAVTLFAVGIGGHLFTLLGWHHKFMNVSGVFITAIIYGSWMLYRINVFRAKATGDSHDTWAEAIGLMLSRPRKITTTPTQVIIDVEHGKGETIKEVRNAAEKLEDAGGAIVGRTTVTANERGGGSQIAFTIADPFDEWRPFPGLSHPGGLFAHPFRTAYYATGEDQFFGFTPGRPSPITDFRAPSATFVGLVGGTGFGKSGAENNIGAEGLSRRHTIVCWVDAEKLLQNAGWCLDLLGMAAKNRAQARRMSLALRKLAEYRVELFGQISLDAALDPDSPSVGGREWSDELAEETGEDAVLVIMDEADTYLSKGEWDWLGKRGRSLGIFLVPSVPRASTQEVPAAFRGSIAAWMTFAIGDKYSGEFTLSQKARDQGADPESLRIPGCHYFDLAPGVSERMWGILCREFWSDGPTMLRRMVLAARHGVVLAPSGPVRERDDGVLLAPSLVQVGTCPSFTPGKFSENAIMWMGEDYAACTPAATLALRGPEHPARPDGGGGDAAPGAAPAPGDMEQTQKLPAEDGGGDDEEDDVEPIDRTEEGAREPEGDEGVVATLAHPGLPDGKESDPREPWQTTTTGIEVPEDKPAAPNEEQENADIDQAIVALASEGVSEFTPADFVARLRYAMNPWTVSRRLGGLCESERIIPPGVKLERIKGGYMPVRTGPSPRPSRLPREGDR
jgi:hypothetical protein